MPDAIAVLRAFNTIAEQFGENINHIFDVNRLLHSRAVLHECRRIIEERISEDYLPGFRFEDDDHAYWFLKNRGSWATWVFGYPMSPEHWDATWLRMFLTPTRLQYLAEVARAMQDYDRTVQSKIREFENIRERGDAKAIRDAASIIGIARALRALPPGPVRGERDLMAMSSWLKRIRVRFPEAVIPQSDSAVIRLAKRANAYRAIRRQKAAPSGWQIVQLVYLGPIENPGTPEPDKWQEFTHGYFERWEWIPIDGTPPPKTTSIAFRQPASRVDWNRPWRDHRKKGRPEFVD